MKKAIVWRHKMYVTIQKFIDEEIQQIVAWLIHRESAEGVEMHGERNNKFTCTSQIIA